MHFILYKSSVLGFSLWMHTIKIAHGIRQTLSKLNLDALAKESGLRKRQSRKITPVNLVLALVAMASQGAWSLAKEAERIGFLADLIISKQSIRKCVMKASGFMSLVLEKLLQLKVYAPLGQALPDCLKVFARVIIVDSTAIALPSALAPFFPGAHNPNPSAPPSSQLKIQAYYDLLKERFVHFSLSSFRKNDQAASPDILSLCQKNDLILRDLGYFVLKVFSQLNERGCSFVSRFKLNTSLLAHEGDQELDLVKLLRGRSFLDRLVRIGEKLKLKVRLIAVKLPDEKAAQRRRERKNNRDKRVKLTKRTKFLLGYEIFITNLDKEPFPASQLLSFYGLRWRIEILFKAFKQHLNLGKVEEKTLYQVELLFYARLILITFLQNFLYAPLRDYSMASLSPPLSILKFFDWFSSFACYFFLIDLVPKEQVVARWLKQTSKHCCYDKRSRLNFMSCLYSLG